MINIYSFNHSTSIDSTQLSQVYRLWSHIFIHDGFFHLLFNMLTLIQVAPSLEHQLGSFQFGFLLSTLTYLNTFIQVIMLYSVKVLIVIHLFIYVLRT